MLDARMVAGLNRQFQLELFSSHLYLAMSAWSEAQNLPGFARWLRIQADEERAHAMKIYDYLLDQGVQPVVPAVEAPPASYPSIQDVFRGVVEHEKKITAALHELQGLAFELKDYATQALLSWFIQEQVEEEKNAGLMAAHLEMIGDRSAAILNLDHRAGKRGS